MSEVQGTAINAAPMSFTQKVLSDLWLSVLATLAIGFAHFVTPTDPTSGWHGIVVRWSDSWAMPTIYQSLVWEGLAVIYVIVAIGYVLARMITIRILPDLFWVSIVAMLVTWPGVPGSAQVREAISGVSLLPALTPLMAFAALGLGAREVQLFKKAGLNFVLISFLVFFGTFMGSAIIAHIALSLMGT